MSIRDGMTQFQYDTFTIGLMQQRELAMTEPIEVTGGCELITCDKRELRLLRELLGIRLDRLSGLPVPIYREGEILEALKPWSQHYGECQL